MTYSVSHDCGYVRLYGFVHEGVVLGSTSPIIGSDGFKWCVESRKRSLTLTVLFAACCESNNERQEFSHSALSPTFDHWLLARLHIQTRAGVALNPISSNLSFIDEDTVAHCCRRPLNYPVQFISYPYCRYVSQQQPQFHRATRQLLRGRHRLPAVLFH